MITWRFGGRLSYLLDLTEAEYNFEYYGGVSEDERQRLEMEAVEDFF